MPLLLRGDPVLWGVLTSRVNGSRSSAAVFAFGVVWLRR